MKKILSMILTLAMVLSLAVSMGITVSAAPEGTAINSAADFAAMKADGKYYLNADITLDASYANEFTGTFDGNGKTVTITTNAMFTEVNGATIFNFIVKGDLNVGETLGYSVGGSEDFYAAVAVAANGASTFKNITSNVNFTTTGAKTRWGAIAATSREGHKLLIDSCVNNGNVNAVSYAGGVYGWAAVLGDSTIKNCVNNGNITLSNGYGAGICCRLAGKGEGGKLTIENCTNNGAITVNHDQAAGIMAYANTPVVTIKNCVNNGEIKNTKSHAAGIAGGIGDPGAELTWTFANNVNTATITATASGKYAGGIVANIANPNIGGRYYVTGNLNTGAINGAGGHTGGIVGYAYGRGTDAAGAYITVNGNINTGVITNTGFTSQILAYTNQPLTTITNNIGIGKVVGTDANKTAFIGFSSADFAQYTIKDNYLVEDGLLMYSYTATAGKEAFCIKYADRPEGAITIITEAQLADSVAKINTALGTTTFALKDGKPALAVAAGANANAGCQVAPAQTPATADASFAIVALLASMTLAFVAVSKKRAK